MTSDESAAQVISKHLTGDERLLWAGRPQQGFILRSSDSFWIPFSLLWTAFAVFWEYQAIASGAPLLWRLWGVPFLLAGIYLIAGRFVIEKALRSHTFYGVTSRHVIIVSGLQGQRVARLATHDVPSILAEERKGTGTIAFGTTPHLGGLGTIFAWPGSQGRAEYKFERIEHAREVSELIRGSQA